MSVKIYAMYNNKGGVGKTTLGFNIASQFAEQNPETQVLVIDLCPQANISQYLLGGGDRGYTTNQSLQSSSTRRNVVGFLDWLLDGNSNFTSIRRPFKVQVNQYNSHISKNLFLIAGDSFLESLTLALNYAVISPANRYAWMEYMTAFRRLCNLEHTQSEYNDLVVFIDCNPSFSIYTQMALLSSDMLIVPMMADYSSLEGMKGIMTLLYGHYPSAAAKNYAEKFVTFHSQAVQNNLEFPKLDRFIFNNFTTNLGVASAYDSIKESLCSFAFDQYVKFPDLFTNRNITITDRNTWQNEFLSEVKDFHTSGKVSASLGIPLFKLTKQTHYTMPNGEEINVVRERYREARTHVDQLVNKFN
ncbi:ParA family protein [Morganella morganii]|uniref:ParA family protein n=1 Tax=Morganella morganii TaxID=582 RepID=UPI00220828ED|nr:ParA family protein [Morganella morganii]EGT3611574.1 ParA family protein [Morganella morganii]UXJ04224.1 ParA family protein [Morganella morganii]WHZ54578.1 ParA family protein [Morganella morganii]